MIYNLAGIRKLELVAVFSLVRHLVHEYIWFIFCIKYFARNLFEKKIYRLYADNSQFCSAKFKNWNYNGVCIVFFAKEQFKYLLMQFSNVLENNFPFVLKSQIY